MGKFKFLSQKEQIIQFFKEGKQYTEIASLLNSNNIQKDACCIRNLVISELGKVKSNRKTVIEGNEEILLQMATEGHTPVSMSKVLNINPVTINSWFNMKHPEIRFRPYKGNVHYFENIDSYSKAYIVGFIAADGSLVKNRKTSNIALTITVKYEDKAVLEFIKSEIGNTHALHEIIRSSSFDKNKNIHHIRYCISDKNIVQDLNKLGITSNKSLTMGNIIENIPYKYRDAFIIGYFDGDGCVTIRDGLYLKKGTNNYYPDYSLYIQLRGTNEFFKGICKHLNITESHIRQHDSIPQLSFANKKDVVRFFQCYNNLSFYYKRKHDIFLKRINHPSFDKYKQVQTISSPVN